MCVPLRRRTEEPRNELIFEGPRFVKSAGSERRRRLFGSFDLLLIQQQVMDTSTKLRQLLLGPSLSLRERARAANECLLGGSEELEEGVSFVALPRLLLWAFVLQLPG